MGKGQDPVTGYKYSFGIHMGLGRGPVDEIIEIKVGDKLAWTGSVKASGDININQPDLFGGDKQEGGIVGKMKIMMGERSQKAPQVLVDMLKHALPGFRRMVTTFFDGQIASNSPYPKAWKFRVRRALKGWENDVPWYPEKAIITLEGPPPDPDEDEDDDEGSTTATDVLTILAMNPAHIIYECLTNREWGRGLPASTLDVASFTAAADTLYDEKFGLCIRWSRRDNLESFVQSVLDHIGAAVYADRATSLIVLKLIRKDYDPDSLPTYTTESGILEIREAEVSATAPGTNEVVVEYTEAITGETRTVNAQNLASLRASRGVFNSLKKQYPGLPTADLATRIAQRDLRMNAMALRRFTITFDRTAWNIPPAGVFKISDTVRGIGSVILRVGRVEDGTLTDGTITITAVQDVFGFPQSSFLGIQPPNWNKPDTLPQIKRHRAFEVPYFLLRRAMKPADFDYLGSDVGFLGTVVEKPTPLSMAYDLYVRSSAPTPDDEPTT